MEPTKQRKQLHMKVKICEVCSKVQETHLAAKTADNDAMKSIPGLNF